MASFFRGFGKDIGIDLGTSCVLVYVRGRGIVLREPSLVAVDKQSGRPLRVGEEARDMLRRTPGNVVAMRPMQQGVIGDFSLTEHMLRELLRKSAAARFFKPRLVICVPSGISEVEERAVIDAGLQAGAKRVYLIEEPMAAAIGEGIDITAPDGRMIVDIGGGTTDIAVISLGAIAEAASLHVAGDSFDEAIVKYIRAKHSLLLGGSAAEALKCEIGCVQPLSEARFMEIKGRCLRTGLPKTQRVSSTEMAEALAEVSEQILEAVQGVLERTPPELLADIKESGILMTGGGSLIAGLDRLIAARTGVSVRLAEEPMTSVVFGTGKTLEDISKLRESMLGNARGR